MIIKYKMLSKINTGTDEEPIWEDGFADAKIVFAKADQEAVEALVSAEAYNGEYTVEDDGRPDPVKTTAEDVLNALLGVSGQ